MKLKSWLQRIAVGALCLLICGAGLCQSAFASGLVARCEPPIKDYENKAKYSFTIKYKPHWNVGAQFRLYKVASVVDKDVKFTPTSSFESYFVDWEKKLNFNLNKLDEKYDWDGLADKLDLIVSTDGIGYTKIGRISTSQPGDAVVTSKDGGSYVELKFAGLYPGLYLVVGDPYQIEETLNGKTYTRTYTPNTYLVCIPNWSDKNGDGKYEWVDDVVADAVSKVSSTTETTKKFLVYKVWDDKNDAAHIRPQSIQVVLYRGGTAIETVTLNEDNRWRWTWTGLPVTGRYIAMEVNVPAGYTVHYNFEVGWTGITNTYDGGGGSDPPPPDDPPNNPPNQPPNNPPNDPPEVPIEDPDVPLGNVTPPPVKDDPPEEIELDDPDVPLGDLPQTGMLWWPVPVMAVSGLILLLIGIVRHRNGEFYDE